MVRQVVELLLELRLDLEGKVEDRLLRQTGRHPTSGKTEQYKMQIEMVRIPTIALQEIQSRRRDTVR